MHREKTIGTRVREEGKRYEEISKKEERSHSVKTTWINVVEISTDIDPRVTKSVFDEFLASFQG